jgi:hypothetical protein
MREVFPVFHRQLINLEQNCIKSFLEILTGFPEDFMFQLTKGEAEECLKRSFAPKVGLLRGMRSVPPRGSNCVGSQGETEASLIFQQVLSRIMTLMIASSLRMQAVIATLNGLWLARSFW